MYTCLCLFVCYASKHVRIFVRYVNSQVFALVCPLHFIMLSHVLHKVDADAYMYT